MTATATRHSCIYGLSSRCTRGDGAPKHRKCEGCGGTLRTEMGTWGIFVWTSDGRYPAEDAVQAFTREAQAERFATRDDRYVVRWISW